MSEKVKCCTACFSEIHDKKSYRCLYPNARDRFTYILEELHIPRTGHLCKFCINKLNKVHRLDEEIRTKLPSLKRDRLEIVTDLRDSFAKCKNAVTSTPRKPAEDGREKRLWCSPTATPRTTKVRRLLPFSPTAASQRQSPVKQKHTRYNYHKSLRLYRLNEHVSLHSNHSNRPFEWQKLAR